MLSAFGGVFTLTFAALLNAHVDYSRAATTANKVAEDEGEYNYQNILKPVTAKISHFEEKSLLIDYCSRSGKAYQFCIDEWDTIIVYRINYASDSNLVDEFAAIYTAHLAELESEKATE